MLSKLEIEWIIIWIVITIPYLTFAIWNVFIAKKQITMSAIDAVYYGTVGILCGGLISESQYGKTIAIIGYAILILWSVLICYKISKNEKEKKT